MPRNFKQFTLDDRESIVIGIMRCQSLNKIAVVSLCLISYPLMRTIS